MKTKLLKNRISLNAYTGYSQQFMPGISPATRNNINLIAVHRFGKVRWLKIHEITYLSGEGNYTYIYTQRGEKYMISKTLKTVQQILQADYIRVHKSYVVNREQVLSWLEADMLLMKCGAKVPIARRRIREVHELLSGDCS